jgi:hypothetical protein
MIDMTEKNRIILDFDQFLVDPPKKKRTGPKKDRLEEDDTDIDMNEIDSDEKRRKNTRKANPEEFKFDLSVVTGVAMAHTPGKFQFSIDYSSTGEHPSSAVLEIHRKWLSSLKELINSFYPEQIPEIEKKTINESAVKSQSK